MSAGSWLAAGSHVFDVIQWWVKSNSKRSMQYMKFQLSSILFPEKQLFELNYKPSEHE